MRILLIALCCALISPLVGQENQSKTANANPIAKGKQGDPSQPRLSIDIHLGGTVKTEASAPKQEDPQEKPRPFMTHGEWVMSFLTLAYVAIALFGLLVINQQTAIAKKAADAASTNALALMNAERAWIVVDVRRSSKIISSVGAAEIVLNNLGKTVALVKELIVKIEAVNSIQDVNGSAEEGESLVEAKDVIIAPGEPFIIPRRLPQTVSTQGVAVRGIVKYCDANGRPWYTRFLFLSNPVGMHDPIAISKVPHGYYNSYGQDYEDCTASNSDSDPL